MIKDFYEEVESSGSSVKTKTDLQNYGVNYLNELRKKGFSAELSDINIKIKIVTKLVKNSKFKDILEIGCAVNPMFPYFDFNSYTIVEPNGVFVEQINKDLPTNVLVIQNFIENISFKKKFDLIIMSGVLHEVQNPGEILQTLHKFSHKNTLIHINLPNAFSFHRVLAYESGIIKSIFQSSKLDKILKRHQFDKKRLLNLLHKNNFKIISTGTFLTKVLTNSQLEILINQKIVSKKILKGLEKINKYIPELGCYLFANVKIKT
ncbi:class I SAM-dependent methyltransferase [Candidatus Woesearchaeota archaeon]|nr:class I SAM-dependent methyltransferase [Candidatus Woesearchaeota archaeon]